VTKARYGAIPHAYVMCTRDDMVRITLQHRLAKEIDAVSARPTLVTRTGQLALAVPIPTGCLGRVHRLAGTGFRLDADACFGINEAGLVMATFLASAAFSRCPVGYLKCQKARGTICLDDASYYPDLRSSPSVVICDFEVKHADVVGFIARQVRDRYPGAGLYFAVFGELMAAQVSFPDLAQRLGDAVREVMDELRPRLVESALSGDYGERVNTRHAGRNSSPPPTPNSLSRSFKHCTPGTLRDAKTAFTASGPQLPA
jgi:hypothetical protein